MIVVNKTHTHLFNIHLPTKTAMTIAMDITTIGTTMATTREVSQAAPVYDESQVQISGEVHLPLTQALK